MKITVLSSKAVRPAYGGGGVAPADDDVMPLTVFDKANFDKYISGIYAFHPPAAPPNNAVLEAGLARALAEYREWAGRLRVDAGGDRAIHLNDAGARFVEATADVALDMTLLRPTPEVLGLHPSGDGAEELLLLQVTRFACGSLTVGYTMQHVVADGRATCNFLLAWGQATRSAAIDPVPVHDRASSFFTPRDPPRVQFEHRGVEFKLPHDDELTADRNDVHDDEVVAHRVHFSRQFISKLKSQASAGAPQLYSTLQCVVAHLWRCMTKARGLDGLVSTSVCIPVDGRARMRPPVPQGYTGNVVLWARPTTTARDLVARPLRHAVELINREVARIDDGYFKSFIDFASSGAVEEERLVATADAAELVLSPNVEVVSLLRAPFHDLDLGGGRPFFFMLSYLPVEGLLVLLPSSSGGDGGVDAYVHLFSRDMDTFKNLCYSTLAAADARL